MAKRKRTDYIVIHVTATPPGWTGGVAGIRQIHKSMGWSDIGYNELITTDGVAHVGRGYDEVGAHVAGFNSISYGISLFGGVNKAGKPDASTITAAQWRTLESRLRELVKKYPKAKICGHRDLSPDLDKDGIIESGEHIKACPCFDAIPWAEARGLPGANIRGDWSKEAKVAPTPVGPDSRTAYLQRLLARAGFSFGAIDGHLGPKTASAISAYQAKFGLPITRTFDAATTSHLRARFELQPGEAQDTPTAVVVSEKPEDVNVVKVPGPKKDETTVIATEKIQKPAPAVEVPSGKSGLAVLAAIVVGLSTAFFDSVVQWFN